MVQYSMTPTKRYAITRAAGPPVLSVFPDATNKPVPSWSDHVSKSSSGPKPVAPTDGTTKGNHLQMPPLQLAGEQGIRRVDVGRVEVIVVSTAVVLRVVGPAPVPRSAHGGRGRDLAARVSAERVDPAAQVTSMSLRGVVHVRAGQEDAALGPRVLLGAEAGHLDVARETHRRGGSGAGRWAVENSSSLLAR